MGLCGAWRNGRSGRPKLHYTLNEKDLVWEDMAPKLYAQAVAAQWNPNTAINWEASFKLDDDVENAVVQVMTYLIENENAALQVPAKFIASIHPHFREVLQLLVLGKSNKEVAHQLDITVGTTKKHRENLQRKLDCHSAAEMTLLAIREGLLTP